MQITLTIDASDADTILVALQRRADDLSEKARTIGLTSTPAIRNLDRIAETVMEAIEEAATEAQMSAELAAERA